MKWTLRLSLAGFALAGLVSSAAAFDAGALAAARRDLQRAVNHGDADRLLGVRARLVAMAEAEPQTGRLQVWIATATWRVLPLVMSEDRKQAERLGDDALARLDRVLDKDPRNAEALALKGGLQGLLISLKPDVMMTLGPQSGVNLARAAGLAPENPRVELLTAVGTMHKPAAFGGGPKPALAEFRRAQELFARESVADSTAPDWGRDDACLWEGRAEMELGDYAAALAAFRAALHFNPDNGWVKMQLLPAAEDSVAREKK